MDFTIEELSMNAWPSLGTVLYDGWILRMAEGYTKRANSVNPVYPSNINLAEKIAYCSTLYSEHGLPLIFKLADCGYHREIDAVLGSLNYETLDLTSVQACENLDTVHPAYRDNFVEESFSHTWLDGFFGCNNIKEKDRETIKAMLGRIVPRKITVCKMEGKAVAGCGYGVIERGYVGLFDIIVAEHHRGKGYGEEIVRTILSEAKKQGASSAYLQVVDANTRAKNLYKKIGFREVYKYWYRKEK